MSDTRLPAQPASPIADLSYRTYDGPLHTRAIRWWVVASATSGIAFKKWAFWALTAVGGLSYLLQGFLLYLQSRFGNQVGMRGRGPFGGGPFGGVDPAHIYASAFYNALSWQSFFILLIALLVGSAAIAGDIRANALLVYLSKPITKADYLLGKWVGLFLAIFTAILLPALPLYLYCLLSYTGDGFLSNDPGLILRILAVAALFAAVHTSLLLGFSAWSKTPRMAGAAYAAFYFVTWIISGVVWGMRYRGDVSRGLLENHLSVGGVMSGLAQNIYAITLHSMRFHRHQGVMPVTIAAPPLAPLLVIAAVFIIGGVLAARARIRAVEVVRG